MALVSDEGGKEGRPPGRKEGNISIDQKFHFDGNRGAPQGNQRGR